MKNLNHDQKPNESFVIQVGHTVIGISTAYVGLKIGQEIFNFDLPYYTEMRVATAIGSVTTNPLNNKQI